MKRIRIFAGPNGSGKSTLVKEFIENDPRLINTEFHIDPDKLNIKKIIDFEIFGIRTDISEFKDYLLKSTLFQKSKIDINDIKFENDCLINDLNNPYMGSLVADFIRDKLLDSAIVNGGLLFPTFVGLKFPTLRYKITPPPPTYLIKSYSFPLCNPSFLLSLSL